MKVVLYCHQACNTTITQSQKFPSLILSMEIYHHRESKVSISYSVDGNIPSQRVKSFRLLFCRWKYAITERHKFPSLILSMEIYHHRESKISISYPVDGNIPSQRVKNFHPLCCRWKYAITESQKFRSLIMSMEIYHHRESKISISYSVDGNIPSQRVKKNPSLILSMEIYHHRDSKIFIS